MKYLRKYNESISPQQALVTKNELLDFCEMSLVYLLDEGLELQVHDHCTTAERYVIYLGRGHQNDFNWFDIKEDFTTFLERLIEFTKTKNLKVEHITIFYWPLSKTGYRNYKSDRIDLDPNKILKDKTLSKSNKVLEGLQHVNYISIDIITK